MHAYAVPRRLVLAAFIAASTLSTCLPDRITGGADGNLGWKTVQVKRLPNILVATDRTECVVTEQRWLEVRVGERVFCHWQRPRDVVG